MGGYLLLLPLGFLEITIILDKGGENAACLSSEASVAFAQSVGPVAFTTATAFKRVVIADGSNFNCGQSYLRECTNVGQTGDTRSASLIAIAFVLKDLELVLSSLNGSTSE